MTVREVFRLLVVVPWIVFLIYWIVSAIRTRVTVQTESFASRYAILLIEVVGFVLLFRHSAGIGFLGTRFMHRTLASAIAGLILIWMGIGLAIWARYHLAEYWSARITIKEDHELIRTGPYGFVRHPIYTGMLSAILGTAISFGEWRGLLAFALLTVALLLKLRREERFMSESFPNDYPRYRAEVPALIPFIASTRAANPD